MTTIVTGLLEKSGSLLAEEVWSELKEFMSFDKEVRKLESTLRAIQAVLEDAEKKQVSDKAVELWLDKLKEAAYDVDNVLDELDTAIIKAKIEEEEEKAETTTATAKVWPCISCISWLFTKIKKLVHRHGIVQEIKKLNETLDEIAKEKDRYSFVFESGSSSSTNIDIGKWPKTISEVDVSDIIGRKEYSDDLVRNLLGEDSSENERNPYVISLVGMGGIGKTTLAQLAYNDDKVKSHFDIRMWVCVSEPFDISRVAKAIIQEIKRTVLDNDIKETLKCILLDNDIELQTLVITIKDLIQGKRSFLVLDDVWTEDYQKWEQLKLALNYGAQGSRILVTTRSKRVTIMVNSDPTISLDALSEDDCWLIFSKIAFVDKDEYQCGQLINIGRELVKRCKGLPLAAKTLGSLMHYKRSSEDWRNILENNLWELEDVKKVGGIDDIDGCKLGELKNLNHLKGSLTIKRLKNVTDVQEAENAQLKDKKHLRELRLSFDEGVEEIESVRNDEIVLKALEPHPNLEILKIDNYMGRVYPNWMKSLSNLKRLQLYSWHNLEQLPPLGQLQCLETLKLRDANSVKKVGVEFLGIEEANGKNGSTSSLVLFPNLKSLQFWDMKEWEEWDGIGERREEEGESGVSVLISIMPRLQFLDIWRCPKLKALPNFLETTSLKQLEVDCRISNWMTWATLSGLKTLCLGLNNDVEHLPPLGKLLLVESLDIRYGHRVKKVGVEFLGIEEESNNKKKKIDDEKGSTSSSSSSSLVLFPNLKSLTFGGLKEWEEWDGIGGTMREEEAQDSGVTITIMPRLQSLQIHDCPNLKSLPDFLPTTPLKTLEIIWSPILSECCKTEIGDQWPKISHIPNIYIDHTWVRRDGRPMQN
uniref:Uncharacterized protein n=1 Tax=Quercus lobata TaxID=97700 RepID=A0A7N2R4F9_QUELO